MRECASAVILAPLQAIGATSGHARLRGIQPTASASRRTRRPVDVDLAGRHVAGHTLAHGNAIILVAAPVQAAEGSSRGAVALVYAGLGDRLRPSLKNWTISSPSAGSFVVLRDGNEVLIASQPPVAMGYYLGQRLPIASPQARALALAAQGGESELETQDAAGGTLWSVTRPLNELGCGLIGMVDRSTALAGMHMTLLVLVLLDVGAPLNTDDGAAAIISN